MKRFLTFFIFCSFTFSVSAQEMWGFSNSNYSGNMGIFLNPSTIVGAPYSYEMNLIAGDLFAQNTYIYFPIDKNIIWRSLQFKQAAEKNDLDLYTGKPQAGFGRVLLIGPSYINNKEQIWAWGFHTALRAEVSAVHAAPGIAKFIYEKYKFKPIVNQRFNESDFAVALMSWIELGGTYGKEYNSSEKNYVKWAATGNLLIGTNAINLLGRNADYTVEDSAAVTIHNLDATLYQSLESAGFGKYFKPRGYGISTTLGVTYIRDRNGSGFGCNTTRTDQKKYRYRAGASLVDVGFIRYMADARKYSLNTTTDKYWDHLDTIPFNAIATMDTTLNNHINSDPSTSVTNKSFTMFLPVGVSLQLDYSFTAVWYANISLMNRIYFSKREVARSNSAALSVRYETKAYEINGNFSYYEFKLPAVGVAFRYKSFVIGTDRLLEWLNVRDVKAFDLFFGFKWNMCDLPWKKKADCPAFGRL